MRPYRICEECGAALDPGERCDCQPAAPLELIQPGRPGWYIDGLEVIEDADSP